MLLIFFLVGFNYSILRATKDALVVTAPSSGAEALPFIKVWAILPMALLFTFIFTRVSNRVSREKVFYVMMSIFIVFFLVFTFALFPFRSLLLRESLIYFLFLPVLRCFNSRRCFSSRNNSEISGSKPACGSPKLIAACHVLHQFQNQAIRLTAYINQHYALASEMSTCLIEYNRHFSATGSQHDPPASPMNHSHYLF